LDATKRQTAAEAEGLLRVVMRRAVAEWLLGTWRFVQGDDAAVLDDAIAVVQIGGRRSALMRIATTEARGDLYKVFA
jgi:hypothetical protein